MAKQSEKRKWIIALSGSEWDDVAVYSFEGTTYQAKRVLANIVKEDKKENNFDYGSEKISEIKERQDGSLYAGSTFSDCHTDYTATPVDQIEDIKAFMN
jgi:hypothetical protein